MDTESMEKEKVIKKRLSLETRKHVRASLTKLMRARYNNTLDTATFRDMVYGFNALLAGDRHEAETEMNRRIEQLEKSVRGEGGIVVDGKDIDSPYAQDLKMQLARETKNSEMLQSEIMELRRQIAKLHGSTD